MSKKLFSLFLALMLLLTSVTSAYGLTNTMSDMPDVNHWSYNALNNAINNGLLQGYNNKLNPTGNATRAQLAAVMNRAFGAIEASDISSFKDVSPKDWYYTDMAKALNMGTFKGSPDNMLLPLDTATRQETFCVIARALKLSSKNTSVLSKFSDKDDIAAWAQEELAALVENNYLHGSYGKLNPNGKITLAELAQIMDNIIKSYITKAGTYTMNSEGNVMVNQPDVVLKDTTINGDLIIGEGVGNGDITLDNTKIEGRLVARGGGQNTILIKNKSSVGSVIISKTSSGAIRIKTEEGANVEYVHIVDGKNDVIIEGTYKQVIVETDTPVVMKDTVVSIVDVKAEGADISIEGKSSISNLNIDNLAQNSQISIAEGAYVDKRMISAEKVKIIDYNRTAGEYVPAKEPLSVATMSAINTKQIQIVFNKAMNEVSATDVSFYEIKDKGTDVITPGAITLTDPKTALITLESNDRLTYNVAAKVTVKKGIMALDGSELANDITFEVTAEEPLSVTAMSAINTKQIQIVFNRAMNEVSATDVSFYEIKDKGTDVITPGAIILTDPKTALITLEGNDRLTYNVAAKVTVKKGIMALDGSELESDIVSLVDVATDMEAPTVTTAELIEKNSYIIHFNEEVSKSFAENPANYDFYTTEYNEKITFVPTLQDDKKSVSLYIPKGLRDNTDYSIVVKNAEDLRENISSDINFTFTCGEFSDPAVEVNKCFTINNEGKIVIYFSEPMNENDMLYKSSYKVATTPGAIYTSLGTDDIVYKNSDRSIVIDLNKTVNSPSVMMSYKIRDLSGKCLNNSFSVIYVNDINPEKVIKSADLIAKNKVKLTFNTKLKTFAQADISFTNTEIGIESIESMITNEEGNTEIIVALNKELNTDVTYNSGGVIVPISLRTKADTHSESVFGTKLEADKNVSINDKVAPKVITFDHDSDPLTDPVEKVVLSGNILTSMVDGKVPKNTTGTITIYYSEAIPWFCLSVLTYLVEGYTVTAISNDADSSELVLSIKANADNTPGITTVTQRYEICDISLNVLAPGKTMTVREEDRK